MNNPVSLSLKYVIPGTRSVGQATSKPIAGYGTSSNRKIPEDFLEWSIENQITMLNDDPTQATKESFESGKLSFPDVLLCGTAW